MEGEEPLTYNYQPTARDGSEVNRALLACSVGDVWWKWGEIWGSQIRVKFMVGRAELIFLRQRLAGLSPVAVLVALYPNQT